MDVLRILTGGSFMGTYVPKCIKLHLSRKHLNLDTYIDLQKEQEPSIYNPVNQTRPGAAHPGGSQRSEITGLQGRYPGSQGQLQASSARPYGWP